MTYEVRHSHLARDSSALVRGTHVRLTWVFSFPIPSPVAYALSDATIAKQLVDKIYEKRKAAALELEKYRHCIMPIPVH
jgi:hypothetical protein